MVLKYILRCVLFFSPLLLLLVLFVVLDPFAMYNDRGLKTVDGSDFKVFEKFDRYNDSLHFDSFIMGDSKTMAILGPSWKKHIGEDESVFKFGGPGEALLNMRRKLEYAEMKGNRIDNVILLLDRKILTNTDNKDSDSDGPVYLKSPKSSDKSRMEYSAKGFYYFLYDGFFLDYFRDCLGNEQLEPEQPIAWNVVDKMMTREEYVSLDPSNQFFRWDTEAKMQNDSAAWVNEFPKPKDKNLPESLELDPRDIEHMKVLRALFDKHHTDYRIVFGPEYIWPDISPDVLRWFHSVFGADRVWNFTVDTRYRQQPFLYYDPAHYRPCVGNELLDSIYVELPHSPVN